MASPEAVEEMANLYRRGGYGYGHAKSALLGVILDRFAEERKRYEFFMQNPEVLEERLKEGAEKAAETANVVLSRLRSALGYS